MRVHECQPAHRRAAEMGVEDASAHRGGPLELTVGVRRLGKADELGLLAVRAAVDGHAPARVVLLRLLDERVLCVQQLVLDRGRLGRDAPEDPAHAPSLRGREASAGCFRDHSDRGEPMNEPRRIWWARPRKLCALERPGGGGRSHRPERREREIEYLKAQGVHAVVSTIEARHNLAAYDEAGLRLVPRARARETGAEDQLEEVLADSPPRAAACGRRRRAREPAHGLRGGGVRRLPRRACGGSGGGGARAGRGGRASPARR